MAKKTTADKANSAKEKAEHYNEPTHVKVKRYLSSHYDFRMNTVLQDCFYKQKDEDETCYRAVNIPDLWDELQDHGFKYSKTNLESLLCSTRFVSQYDPIVEYFEELPKWDGNDYIKLLCNCVVLVDETDAEIDRLYTMFKKWLVRAIRCALGGRVNREVITLKSNQQRIGKTEFIRNLLRKTKLSDYYSETIDLKSKDGFTSQTKNFIINFDEYDKFLYDGVLPALKSYISQEYPKVRVPYAPKEVKMRRICSFFATTNIPDFLRDETGNTRFICFDVSGVEWQKYEKMDINLVWAQAYHLYILSQKGEYQCDLTNEEEKANDLNNLKYLYHSTEYELIEKLFEPSSNPNDFMTATDIADYLHDNTRYKTANSRGVGRALSALGYKRGHCKTDNTKQGYQIRAKLPTNELFPK